MKGKITIFKTDKGTGDKLVGTGFAVYDVNGEKVAEGVTGEDGKLSFELRYGEYTNCETSAPEGYVLNPTPCAFAITDAGFRIYAADGKMVVMEGHTDKNGICEFELEFGKYYYQEFDAPKGYEINDTKYEFEITEDGKVISVKMENKKTPEPEKPTTPDKPSTPSTSSNPKPSTDGPKTGDDANMALWITLAGISLAASVGFGVLSKKNKYKDK